MTVVRPVVLGGLPVRALPRDTTRERRSQCRAGSRSGPLQGLRTARRAIALDRWDSCRASRRTMSLSPPGTRRSPSRDVLGDVSIRPSPRRDKQQSGPRSTGRSSPHDCACSRVPRACPFRDVVDAGRDRMLSRRQPCRTQRAKIIWMVLARSPWGIAADTLQPHPIPYPWIQSAGYKTCSTSLAVQADQNNAGSSTGTSQFGASLHASKSHTAVRPSGIQCGRRPERCGPFAAGAYGQPPLPRGPAVVFHRGHPSAHFNFDSKREVER